MKILLINPNTYKKPPVIPIGLEYLVTSLRNNKHDAKILDLTFSEDTFLDIDNYFKKNTPQLIGITIRNIDSALYQNNVWRHLC